MDSIIARVLKDDWASIQSDVEKLAAEKVKASIDAKKIEVLAKINGVDADQIKTIMTPAKV